MNGLLKQSTARSVSVQFVDSTDSITPKTGIASFTVVAGKNGAAVATITPTMTEQGNGWYAFAFTTAHTDTLGDFCTTITPVSGADPQSPQWQVVVDLPGATVASVVGAVGSVTGAVGSVTGNVGGNVVGTVASVIGNVGGNVVGTVASVVGNVGGNVVGSVASVVAGVTLAAAAITAIWDKLTSALTTSGSIGKLLVDNITGLAAILGTPVTSVSADIANLQTTCNNTGTQVNDVSGAVGALAATVNLIDTDVTDIKAKTDNLPAAPASEGNVSAVGIAVLTRAAPGDAMALVAAQIPFKKNTALAGFPFPMQDSSGNPVTGLTVTAQRVIDGGAIANCTNAVVEVSDGIYKINFSAADLNGNSIAFIMSAPGAVETKFTALTQ